MTGANLAYGAMAYGILMFFAFLSYWRPHPVMLQITGGISMMVGLKTPHLLAGDVSTPMSVSIGLGLIMFSLVCIAFAYARLFDSNEDRE